MKEREVLKLALKALENNKQDHRYCEDTWYSCPKHEDGCANEAEGDECNCGADEINAQFDKAITAIEEALAQPEQKPVAHVLFRQNEDGLEPITFYPPTTAPDPATLKDRFVLMDVWLSLPQRTWVGLTDEDIEKVCGFGEYTATSTRIIFTHLSKAVEAKLKEKNT